MLINWIRNPATGTYHADVDGRTVDIEPIGRFSFEIWYGKPDRRIRIGRADDLSAAKTVAEDLIDRLVSLNTFLEYHDGA
jgi:hypothetical protein